jgi:hypothetical protein
VARMYVCLSVLSFAMQFVKSCGRDECPYHYLKLPIKDCVFFLLRHAFFWSLDRLDGQM